MTLSPVRAAIAVTGLPSTPTRKGSPVTALIALIVTLFALLTGAAGSGPSPDLRPVTDPLTDPRVAFMLVTQGDYAPTAADDVLTGAQWDAGLAVYGASEDGHAGCPDAARRLLVSGDYRPSDRPCLGEEDSAVVDVILTLGNH